MKKLDNIIYEKIKKVGVITLNRPKYLNALCDALIRDLNEALDDAEKDDNINVVVLKGSEKSFAAGADISEMNNKDFVDLLKRDFIMPWERLSKFKKPTIAAVSGYALGGGCEIAMMCDIIVAAENSRFGQPEINLGTIPAAGGTQRLTRSVGKSKAMEMVLSGNMITAHEAKELGLVSSVFPTEILINKALELANNIASKSLPVLIMAKEAVNRAYQLSLEEGMKSERRLFQSTFSLSDRKEGMKAFLEKRKAKFINK
ncbi:MAG: putative enoyl-CoA hydratase echA8 [Alphaproteobacteria bacterium MarineAlpha9_Bin4]|nr:enoyl-CoA hydratase [Pelagibacterales bacterium]PPR27236.1 MAG: putative enoyl-CoA hydratase echA8 [Alphaproteobacteria bacterium MarineAlpha9_Bin4]